MMSHYKFSVKIRGIYATVEKGKVTLIDDHSPHPCGGEEGGGGKKERLRELLA